MLWHTLCPSSIPPYSTGEKVILQSWWKTWMCPYSSFLTTTARKRDRVGGRVTPPSCVSVSHSIISRLLCNRGTDSWEESHGSVVKLTGKSDPLCFSFTVSLTRSLSPLVFTCYQNHVCVCVCCEVLEGHKGHGGAQERRGMKAVTVKGDHAAIKMGDMS